MPNRSLVLKCRLCASLPDICLRYMTGYLDDIEFPKLFCMTDAIGAWLLSQPDERMQRLRALETRAAFVDLVETARADGTMRRDDTTLLVIG